MNGKMILGDKKITVEKNLLIYTGNLCRRRRQAPESYNIKNQESRLIRCRNGFVWLNGTLLPKRGLKKNMYRLLAALLFLVAFTAASLAQDLSPSVWQSERGAILKVLNADSATGNFSGIFISSPTGQCAAVPYDLAGHVQGPRVEFETSRTWTADCSVTTVWSGRFISPTTVETRWVARSVAPDGHVTRIRGTEVFQRI